ncbi:hypothetical protein BCT35_23255 [Vibrio lentus]|uniref:hypothetical protein n=1 Tax=Vibrio lentus TaxID=136468 RepID=UPI000C828267|nr:hypothetical protein [Vibrio lentus]PMN28620.1 hypothetical protein BCT35_23255 [Vibrio lentus]
MKNSDLIKTLSIGAKILSYYKDKDLSYALNDILRMCEAKEERQSMEARVSKPRTNTAYDVESFHLQSPRPRIDYENFIKKSDSMTTAELADYLEDKAHFPNIDSLRDLAVGLGIKGQSRVSRNNIIHSILMVIERKRIHKSISSRHSIETKNQP